MITDLPESLLLHILSFLPTKSAISTSVLSKQWRSLHNLLPKLEFGFDDNESEHETFSEIVCRVLLSHKSPVLESLIVYPSLDRCSEIDIGMWIGIAYARNVREILLNVGSEKGTITLPRAMYNCKTLETLKLSAWIRVYVSSRACFDSLKTLHLLNVDYEDEESVCNLFTGCPNLEKLVIEQDSLDLKVFGIQVPSLQRLTICGYDDAHGFGGYAIKAPSLKYLRLEGLKSLEFCTIENASELVEACIVNVSNIIDENILGSITSVKRLSLVLSPLEITFPTGSIFNQLVYLELSTHKAEWWNLLILMLDSSPILRVLKLIDLYRFSEHWRSEKDGVAYEKWSEPKSVPTCLSLRLETFVWESYKQVLEEEREVAKYILKNTNRLKIATFIPKPCYDSIYQDMVKDLESVVKGSSSFELVCKFISDEEN
ncbi:unnamed protein product [Cochlearia groenlandica]